METLWPYAKTGEASQLLWSIISAPGQRKVKIDLGASLGARGPQQRILAGFNLLRIFAEEGLLKIALPGRVEGLVASGQASHWVSNLLSYFPGSSHMAYEETRGKMNEPVESATMLIASTRLQVSPDEIRSVQAELLFLSRRFPDRWRRDEERIRLVDAYEESVSLYRETLELIQHGYQLASGDPVLGRAAQSFLPQSNHSLETTGEVEYFPVKMDRSPNVFKVGHLAKALKTDSLPKQLQSIGELEYRLRMEIRKQELEKQFVIMIAGLMPGVSALASLFTAFGLLEEARAIRQELQDNERQPLLYAKLR